MPKKPRTVNAKDSKKKPRKQFELQAPVQKFSESDLGLPVVGIGASAGGLEAFEQFFTHMPPDAGMAFVLIQHLDPSHKSILSELIRRYTRMKVMEVEDGITVEPNTVYVIPPNRYMAILNRKLHLFESSRLPGVRTPIDYFFRTLAEDQKERAICIVLSGTGTEGALGLRAVKGEGGMAMVQDPGSARYDGMPRSAVSTGLADYVLSPDKMPAQLIGYVRHAHAAVPDKTWVPVAQDSDLLQKVFIVVRAQTGHDFSHYKQNTILRRVDRRMAVNQIARMADYVRFLQETPREAEILFKDLLIGVTNFFRDKDAFEVVKEKAVSVLVRNRPNAPPIRIWVPGCATGEEAYSLAILCRDSMKELNKEHSVQIFATDIDHDAIEAARIGLYPDSISVDVPPEILDRYFVREESSFRIKKEIRDMVVFALQNVIADPPFSKMDFISCRNLLIYLGPELQKKVLPLFHYSLRKEGFLFLGSSESIGEFSDYFSVVDRKWKLFRRKESDFFRGKIPEFRSPVALDMRLDRASTTHEEPLKSFKYRDLVEDIILRTYGRPGVLINEKGEVLYIHGRTGKYLEPVPGEFAGSNNILGMAREGLKLELATTIRKATTQKQDVRANHVLLKTNGGTQLVNVVVKPIYEPASLIGTLLVFFEDVPSGQKLITQADDSNSRDLADHPRIVQLEQELSSTREFLQTTIEELETANEELRSTNEELQSANEELQSTNEELETSKEEMQSVNEELTTVNAEHQQKIEELSKTTSDLDNLLAGTEIATIFLDMNLNIRRFTPAAMSILNLIQTDIGRPVRHLATNIEYDGLVDDAREVLRTLIPRDMEVQSKDGLHFSVRTIPYRTRENTIEGVLINFVDISRLKKTHAELQASQDELSRTLAESSRRLYDVFNSLHDAIILTNFDGLIMQINPAAEELFGYNSEELAGISDKIMHVDDKHFQKFNKKLETLFRNKDTTKIQFEARNKNNETFAVRGIAHLLRDAQGKAIGRMFSIARLRSHETN
ncbi:MAG: two-component system, chemotaxis family, CheB/CheR fusion protein [Thermodesulfobacteriota bacterium]|nr:two-component system, chemotaxis family, CheB/CheR fusion protein [Thermodesulfobacteriota bacterium]